MAQERPSSWARSHRWGKDAADKRGQVPHPGLGKEDSMTLALGKERGSYLGTLGSDWLAEGWKGVSSISPAVASDSRIWPWERASWTLVLSVAVPLPSGDSSQKPRLCL